ncbi:MAG TPA: GIY-YIG nuclease family protein [Noviherbaspirillum sp.]|nr:GIY-YIG nuclease family protein [Noviherbaspirillum sp.]
MNRCYYVYITASVSRVLYIGVTNDLVRRIREHKQKRIPGFTRQYNVDRLVYFEQTTDVIAAISREKQLKGWRRDKKTALITEGNPHWDDLYSRTSA